MDEHELEKARTSLLAWEEGMARFAESIVWFQHIEHTLSICISVFSNMDEKIGEIITARMSFKNRVDTLAAVLSHHSDESGLSDDVKNLIKRLRWAEEERNRLIHSMWELSEDNPGQIERSKRTIKKNRHQSEEELFFPADFEDLQRLFEGINTDLVFILSEAYPAFADDLHY